MMCRERNNLRAPADEKPTDIDQECSTTPVGGRRESRIDFIDGAGMQDDELLPDASSCCLQVRHILGRSDTGRIRDDSNNGSLRHEFADQLEPLRPQLNAQVGRASDVAARSVEASDETELDRVAGA